MAEVSSTVNDFNRVPDLRSQQPGRISIDHGNSKIPCTPDQRNQLSHRSLAKGVDHAVDLRSAEMDDDLFFPLQHLAQVLYADVRRDIAKMVDVRYFSTPAMVCLLWFW